MTCVLISALVAAKALKCAFCRMQDFPLPTGGSITAGTWLDPSNGLLSQLPAQAVVNRCSPSPAGAVIFFCSFVLLCGLVLVNFVISVIIDNFASSCRDDGLPVNKDSVEDFAQVCSCVCDGWPSRCNAASCSSCCQGCMQRAPGLACAHSCWMHTPHTLRHVLAVHRCGRSWTHRPPASSRPSS